MYLRPFSLKLLDWAFRNDVYIIEDDYDSELRYHTAPVPGGYKLLLFGSLVGTYLCRKRIFRAWIHISMIFRA